MNDLPASILTHEIFILFSPCPVEKEEWVSGWVGVWQLAKVNLTQILKNKTF